MAGAVVGFHHHMLGVVGPAFDEGVGAGDPVYQRKVPAVTVVQMVDEVPWIDFMDRYDLKSIVVEIGEPFFFLMVIPVVLYRRNVIERFRCIRL